jgi:hypothetical protein
MNIMAEWYARDTSRKVKAVLHAKGSSGKHMTNSALYGYRKHPDDKNQWVIDPEAAEVVCRIFRMTVNGKGPFKIARILTDERVTHVNHLGTLAAMPVKTPEEIEEEAIARKERHRAYHRNYQREWQRRRKQALKESQAMV